MTSVIEVDPVCGREILDAEKALTAKYKGRTFRFCSEKCREEFKRDPDRYSKGVILPT